jgi:hypothetical protein
MSWPASGAAFDSVLMHVNGSIWQASFRCSPSSSSPPSRIIAHLTSKFGGNVRDRNIVNVTANRVYNDSPSYAPKNVADLGSNSIFHSVNEPNQSICFDFKMMKVIPSHYSIRMLGSTASGCHPENRLLEWSVNWELMARY